MLVHAGRGGEHAAPHVRHAHHFEQTLDGAVLAVRPVQHGEHRVHMAERGQRTVILAGEEAVLSESHFKHHVLGAWGFLHGRQAFVQAPSERILTVDDPLAVLGDAHRNGFELAISIAFIP